MTGEPRRAMVDIESTDEHAAITAQGLRLRFDWEGDRWIHRLDAGQDGSWSCVARSVEGDTERDGPARVVSPAFQQLQVQQAEAGAQALLIGQSGPHRFSAVFQVRATEGSVRIEADVVDRCRAAIEGLASTYRVALDAGAIRRADPSGVVWQCGDRRGASLALLPWGPADRPVRIALAESGRTGVQVQAEAALDVGNPTQRWRYQWRWELPNT